MDKERSPVTLWYRRDLRLTDHPALAAAAQTGRPVIPVFLRDQLVDDLGAAPKWRLGLGLAALSDSLERKGSKLILRSGPALAALEDLIRETGATDVYWSRAYDPVSIGRDIQIKTALSAQGVTAKSFAGHLLLEPWTAAAQAGQPFRVYTPMWRAVRGIEVDAPKPEPSRTTAPRTWPQPDVLEAWNLGADT